MKKISFSRLFRSSLRVLSFAIVMMLSLQVSAQQATATKVDGGLTETAKTALINADVQTTDTNIATIGAAFQNITDNPSNGADEKDQALKGSFYRNILMNVKKGSSMDQAIRDAYTDLKIYATNFNGTVDTEAILTQTLNLLD